MSLIPKVFAITTGAAVSLHSGASAADDLIEAVSRGDPTRVVAIPARIRALLNKPQSFSCWMPAHTTVVDGQPSVVNVLLEPGADPGVHDRDGAAHRPSPCAAPAETAPEPEGTACHGAHGPWPETGAVESIQTRSG